LNVGRVAGGINVNSVPDAATIGIDVRTIPSQPHAAVRRVLAAHLGPDVALAPFVQDVFEVAARVLGTRPTGRTAPYFTDASVLTPAFGGPPTVVLGPGELPLAHQTDEYCLVARVEEAVELYVEIARRFCGC